MLHIRIITVKAEERTGAKCMCLCICGISGNRGEVKTGCDELIVASHCMAVEDKMCWKLSFCRFTHCTILHHATTITSTINQAAVTNNRCSFKTAFNLNKLRMVSLYHRERHLCSYALYCTAFGHNWSFSREIMVCLSLGVKRINKLRQ